jgi:hypothetical protein
MAMQMFLVSMQPGFSQETSRDVQHLVRRNGGFILIVTPNGPVVAIDDSRVGAIQSHSQVRAVGGVTLNPKGLAAERLQRIFTENLAKQATLAAERIKQTKGE